MENLSVFIKEISNNNVCVHTKIICLFKVNLKQWQTENHSAPATNMYPSVRMLFKLNEASNKGFMTLFLCLIYKVAGL